MSALLIPLFRPLRRFLALIPLLAALPAAALAANYYVATNGSDTNAGTLAAPFATLMRAQTAAASGDTVYVRGGTYTTFAITATDANYNYVHRFNKNGIHWSAYPGETPLFDFSSVPTNLRVCGFHVTGNGLKVTGFYVTGVKDGAQKQSECWRIDGSNAYVDFYDCVAYNNAANGFYWTNRSRGSATRCDAYNNIGTNGESVGNTDGFGAHGNGVVFRYCRAWNNSDDGYDCISSPGANIFDHCWSFNNRGGGNKAGFKVGGFGADPATVPPSPVPTHTVTYCVSAFNGAQGFYANHHPGQAAVWTKNTAFNNGTGNYNMLERYSDMSADVDGYREVLHYNIAFTGTTIVSDNNPAENKTNNSWTKPGITVAGDDFLSIDWNQLTAPRSAGNNMPFVSFMHLTAGSDLVGLGAFDPPPAAPTGVASAWVNSGQVTVTWAASPDATEYYVKRATSPGGPYTTIGIRLTGTSYADTAVTPGTTYYYVVSAMNDLSYDESNSAESGAEFPSVAITGISPDTGLSAGDAITMTRGIALNGFAGPNASVSVSLTGTGVIGATTADGSGVWTFDYSGTSLADGTHTFSIASTVTGITYTSNPFVVTVDNAPPDAPAIVSVSDVEGSLVISGTAEAGAQVTVFVDASTVAGTAIANGSGAWSFTSAVSVPAGPHAFTASGFDVAGNPSPVSATFTIDTSVAAPVITAVQSAAGNLVDGASTSDNTLAIVGTAPAGATVTISRGGSGVIGAVAADGSGDWSFDYTGTILPDGVHLFTATASLGAGEGASSPVFTVRVDTVAPAVSSIVRRTPATVTITSAVTSVVFRVTFSEPVGGVTTGSFNFHSVVTGNVASVAPVSDSVYDVTIDSLSGSGSLQLDLKAAGSGVADAAGNIPGGFTTGETYTRVISTTGNGTWVREESGGLWSDAESWLNAIIPSTNAHTANFNTLDLQTTNVVELDSARAVNKLIFGDTDTSTPGNWYLDNNNVAANILTLSGTVPTITVNALGTDSNVTIGASLASVSNSGLTKDGAGTLVLAGANNLNGPLAVSGGVLRLDPGSNLSGTTLAVNATGARFEVNGGTFTASGTATITGATGTAAIINEGSATFATLTMTAASGGLIRVNGGAVTIATLTLPRSTDANLNYTVGYVHTGGTATIGAMNVGTSNSNSTVSVEGGSVTASGIVTIGNQTTAGRGGAIRVTGGRFTSTNTATGLLLSRNPGSNTNNTTFANFLGGVSTVEKITLGFDSSASAGTATVNIDGGDLYLGSGGIVKNGAAGLATVINLNKGNLGAKANWSSSLPIALPAANTVVLKAASETDAAFNITLSGVLSGAGGFTKSGAGTLTLSAANTFTGSVGVGAGTLAVNSSLAAGGSVAVNSGGTLAGTGTVNKAIALNNGGVLAPAGAATGTLTGASLTWNGGGRIQSALGATSDRLTLTGDLTKGSAGSYQFVFSGAPAVGSVHTLASFSSTTFVASDFSATGIPGNFSISGSNLLFTVTPPPDAAFNAWASSLPAGQQGGAADPDLDGLPNLLEFALGLNGNAANADDTSALVVNVGGQDYPAVAYTRRIDRGGVVVSVLVSASLDFSASLGSVEVSATPAAAGFETVIVRSSVPLTAQPRQFFRLSATLSN